MFILKLCLIIIYLNNIAIKWCLIKIQPHQLKKLENFSKSFYNLIHGLVDK